MRQLWRENPFFRRKLSLLWTKRIFIIALTIEGEKKNEYSNYQQFSFDFTDYE